MKKLFTLILFVSSFFLANAQWAQLTNAMLEGGRAENFEKQGSNLFVGAEGGIFISTNNGASWSPSMIGFNQHSTYVDALCTHSTGMFCFGGGRLYYSTNGANWQEINPVGLPSNYWITDFQEANNILYAMVVDGSTNDIYMYYSGNGINWTQGEYIGDNSMQFNFDLFNFNDTKQYFQIDTVLYYTSDGININTVNFTGITPPDREFDRSFCGEPNGNYIYYADEQNTTVHRYNTTTEIWEDITSGLPAGIMMITNICAGDDAIFITVLTTIPTLELNLYRSTNNGTTWNLIANPGLGSLPWLDNILQIGTNEYIVANPFNELYHSIDNGTTWTKSQSGYIASRHSSLVEINNSLLSFEEQLGIIRSDDYGSTWSYSNGGLTPFLSDLIFIDDIYKFGSNLYISYQADPMVEDYNIYKSSDNGLNWTLLGTEPDSTNIVFCGQNADGFIIKLFSDNDNDCSYQLTLNDGATWTDISTPISALNLNRNYGFYGSASTWYLFGVDLTWSNVAYRSVNNGVSWTDISTGLNNNTGLQARYEGWGDKQAKIPIDFNSSDQPIIAVQKWDMYPNFQQFFKFNGSSWDIITSTGIDTIVERGTELKNFSGEWIFAANEGVFISQNECVTWQQVHTNHINLLTGTEKYSVQRINDMIFLGTFNNGIWMTDLSVDVDKVFANSDAIVYPNPAEDILYFKNAENANVRILDIYGREIMSFVNVNEKVDISGISHGIYIISITQAGKTENTKVVIQ
ncbi:MAG: T9SS type A sorting domain-containing protein [Bacteroidota bacterium]